MHKKVARAVGQEGGFLERKLYSWGMLEVGRVFRKNFFASTDECGGVEGHVVKGVK